MRIAYLGLGIMGGSMAANLVKAGHQVTTWNRTPGKTIDGARSADTAAQAARNAEIVWICVSDTDAVEQVLFGKDGAAESLTPGTIVVDSSTILPSASRRFAEQLRAKNVEFVDAPVTGSKIGAANASLIFIVGGREAVVEKLQPLFLAMGKQAIHVGENGLGEVAKLAMNLQIALIYEGFAEGLTLVRKLGVKEEALFSLIQASMIRSGVVDYKIPFIQKRDYEPNFPLRLMHKDLRLMLEAAREAGVELPGVETVKRIYDLAHERGKSDLDFAATLSIIEEKAGL